MNLEYVHLIDLKDLHTFICLTLFIPLSIIINIFVHLCIVSMTDSHLHTYMLAYIRINFSHLWTLKIMRHFMQFDLPVCYYRFFVTKVSFVGRLTTQKGVDIILEVHWHWLRWHGDTGCQGSRCECRDASLFLQIREGSERPLNGWWRTLATMSQATSRPDPLEDFKFGSLCFWWSK